MKKLLLLFTLCILLPVSAWAKNGSVRVNIAGMVCESCAQTLSERFDKDKAVERADVSFEKQQVVVALKPGKKLSDAEIRRIVKKAGYRVERISRD